MTDFDPMAYATGGLITGNNRMDGHGLLTVGIIVERIFAGSGGSSSIERVEDISLLTRKEVLQKDDDEILFIIKEFMKWVT